MALKPLIAGMSQSSKFGTLTLPAVIGNSSGAVPAVGTTLSSSWYESSTLTSGLAEEHRFDWSPATSTSGTFTNVDSALFVRGTITGQGAAICYQATCTNRGDGAMSEIIGFQTHIGLQSVEYATGIGTLLIATHINIPRAINDGTTSIGLSRAIRIQNQTVTGVAAGQAIAQEGALDLNTFAGVIQANGGITVGSNQVVVMSGVGTTNPGIIFAGGSGFYTTNGSTIGLVVATNNVSTNTSITFGSTTATVSSASGITSGMSVIGPGIAPGTTITISGTTITLSVAATATNAAAGLTFYTPVSALLADNSGNVAFTGTVSAGQFQTGVINVKASAGAVIILQDTTLGSNKQWNIVPQSDGTLLAKFFNGSGFVNALILSPTGGINMPNVPASSSGLSSGAIYTTANALMRVP